MPFQTIVSGAINLDAREPGIYVKRDITFSDPTFELRVRGATRNRDRSISGSLTSYIEKDVMVNSNPVRKALVAALSITAGPDFTVADIQAAIKLLYDFSQSPGFVSRFMQGES